MTFCVIFIIGSTDDPKKQGLVFSYLAAVAAPLLCVVVVVA